MRKLHSKIHKHLKLQHHRHSGRKLHHEHTSYRALAVILVLAATFMMGVTAVGRAAADSLVSVGGTVMAPVPSASATITTPAAGEVVNSSDTIVAGNCPLSEPQVAIVLTIDDIPVGSALCGSTNDFALPVQLTPGAHRIVAQTHTITYGLGKNSEPVSVTYTPTRKNTAVTAAQPTVSPQAPFSVLAASLNTEWSGAIGGGKAPYKVLIDWGDGVRKDYTVTTAGEQRFEHRYGAFRSYNARIAVTDAAGQSIQQQYAAIAYTTAASLATASTQPAPLITATVAGLYGLFLTVSSVGLIAWLEAKHAARSAALGT